MEASPSMYAPHPTSTFVDTTLTNTAQSQHFKIMCPLEQPCPTKRGTSDYPLSEHRDGPGSSTDPQHAQTT